MPNDTLTGRIHNCLARARFTDVFRRRFDAALLRRFHEGNQFCPLSTDGIEIHQPDLDALVSALDARVGAFKSPVSGAVGNGLYLLMGTSGSPRLPPVEEYAKILVLAASRIGAARTADLLAGWLSGAAVPSRSCALLTGIETDGVVELASGLRLETLPPIVPDISRWSIRRVDQYGTFLHESDKRTILTVEYETVPGFYDPDAYRETLPPRPIRRTPVNRAFERLTPARFCQAMSVAINNHVDWSEQWDDHADAEAFSLNPNYSHVARGVRSRSTVEVTAEQVLSCLEFDARASETADLALPIARWFRSKRSPDTHEQLIELRIALEAVFLNDDKGDGEKRHRLAARGAWFLGQTPEQRRDYFDVLKVVCDYASTVIHGGVANTKKRDMTKDIALAQDLCRKAILRSLLSHKVGEK